MNLKRTLFTGLAAVGLMASVAAPMASAQYNGDSGSNNMTYGVVYVSTPGQFDVYFSSGTLDFGTVTLTAGNPLPTVNGTLQIAYVDTFAYRPSFDVTLQATNFLNTANHFTTPITAAGFDITTVANLAQGYWGGPGRPGSNNPGNVDVGDLGAYVNEDYVSQGGTWPKAWTADQSLDASRKVQFGYTGSGTSWGAGNVGVSLDIPNNTVQGNYRSEITLTVVTGTQP